jgi:hypothetical protein
MLGAQFITNQEKNLCTSPTRLNRTENNKINVTSQDMIAFQPTVFLPEYMNYWSITSNALTTLQEPLLRSKSYSSASNITYFNLVEST